MRIEEVCFLLGFSPAKLQVLRKRGKFPAPSNVHRKKPLTWRRADILAYDQAVKAEMARKRKEKK